MTRDAESEACSNVRDMKGVDREARKFILENMGD